MCVERRIYGGYLLVRVVHPVGGLWALLAELQQPLQLGQVSGKRSVDQRITEL